MYIYSGKLDYDQYAKNECFTLVFPAGFALHDPISAHWQWSKDANGRAKVNQSQSGLVTRVSKTIDEYSLTANLDYYAFEITLAPNRHSITLVMTSPRGGLSGSITMAMSYSNKTQFPTTITYTGKLDYSPYATNEMVTLILPTGISSNAPVGLYYQFTVDGAGIQKRNEVAVGMLSNVREPAAGAHDTVTARFNSSYYRYQFTFSADQTTVSTTMMGPQDNPLQTIVLKRGPDTKPPMGVKKALIVRFNTGSDVGIFRIRDMLTKNYGFNPADVQMMFFDVDEFNGRKLRTGPQDPPTAKRFKDKFISHLLSGARSGDVLFLYVDAHGASRSDEEHSGEVDGIDEGWRLAQDDAGKYLPGEAVFDDWLSKTIRENIRSGVNLTILTSSCLGGGILDPKTPGILLAGCHETQFNVKAFKFPTNGSHRVDPWMYAVTEMVDKRVKKGRGVPTYTELFNEAKKYIRNSLMSDDTSEDVFSRRYYLGQSPNESRPIAGDRESRTSHQDPQLICYDGFIDPDTERFLFPIAAPTGNDASGEATTRRYPHDEL